MSKDGEIPAGELARGKGEAAVGIATLDPTRPSRTLWNRLRWPVVIVVVIALAGFSVAYGRLLAKKGATAAWSPLVGKSAPGFSLPGLDGHLVSSRTYSGHVLIINFWASWCVVCGEEAAYLENFYRRTAPTGIGLVGIVYSDSAANADAFDAKYGVTYPNAADPNLTTAFDYGVTGVPETFVISSGGIVVAHLVGAVGPTTLDALLIRLTAGGAPVEGHGPGFEREPAR